MLTCFGHRATHPFPPSIWPGQCPENGCNEQSLVQGKCLRSALLDPFCEIWSELWLSPAQLATTTPVSHTIWAQTGSVDGTPAISSVCGWSDILSSCKEGIRHFSVRLKPGDCDVKAITHPPAHARDEWGMTGHLEEQKWWLISSGPKKNITIPFVSFKTTSWERLQKRHFCFQCLLPLCVKMICERTAYLPPWQRSKFNAELNDSLWSLTHLKSFQVLGKLGLLCFLYVQLLCPCSWALAGSSLLGLFLWSLSSWSSEGHHCSV